MPKIFESPDRGRTVYEREFGNERRTLIFEENSFRQELMEDQLWQQIRKTARTNTALQAELDRVIMFYNLIKDHE